MAKTTSPGEGDDRRKPKKPRKPVDLTKAPAKTYAPGASGGTMWTAMQSAVLDNKPPFTPWFIPRMMGDPTINFGLNQLVGPLTMVQWDIKAKSPEVQQFVTNTVKKFWRRSMPLLAFNGFAWGYAPGIHDIDMGPDGGYRYARCRWVNPQDAVALQYEDGPRRGELAGFRLTVGVRDSRDGDVVAAPFAAWYGGLERLSQFYDNPRLRAAYDPWLEKNTRAGALNSRRLYFHTHAFRGQVIYHPPGPLDPNDANGPQNKDYAMYVADMMRNGSSLVFPDIQAPGEGRNESAWRVEPIEGNASAAVNILEYTSELDKEILIGLGIPPEVVEAADTGSGFSGRKIPFLSLMTQMDLAVGPLVGCIEPVIREMVNHNYDGAEFTIDTVPLAETADQQNNPNAKSAVGGMAPAGGLEQPQPDGQAAPDAAMAGSGGGAAGGDQEQGGDPSAGGLVAYQGKRGGRGKKDPYTGRVYYMSHAGTRLGCLMADIPEPLASACLSFAQTIPPEHFVEDGHEPHPHVTLHYGLTQIDPTPVLKAVSELGSLSFAPGALKVFEKDDCDVLYVSCEDESKWRRWHRHTENLPCEPSEHDYCPHLTLAYLKRGKGKLYAGKTALRGEPVPIATVVYSGPDGRETRAQVWPSADELAELFTGRVGQIDLAWSADRSSTGGVKAVWDGEGGDRKPLYGENAERVLRGDLPVAEKLQVAQRVAVPEVKAGQKLVRSRDYRDGMEPPAADRHRDSLDRDIAAANAKGKAPLPVAQRAKQPTPPVMAKRPPQPAKPVSPPKPPLAKPPLAKPKTPPPPLKPPELKAPPAPQAKAPTPPPPATKVTAEDRKVTWKQRFTRGHAGYNMRSHLTDANRELLDRMAMVFGRALPPDVYDRKVFLEQMADTHAATMAAQELADEKGIPYKPAKPLPDGFDDVFRQAAEEYAKKYPGDSDESAPPKPAAAPSQPPASKATAAKRPIPDQNPPPVRTSGGTLRPGGAGPDLNDDGLKRQRLPAKPAPKPAAWEDEYRELQNRHDAGDRPLKADQLRRLNELQAKAGVPEANRAKPTPDKTPPDLDVLKAENGLHEKVGAAIKGGRTARIVVNGDRGKMNVKVVRVSGDKLVDSSGRKWRLEDLSAEGASVNLSDGTPATPQSKPAPTQAKPPAKSSPLADAAAKHLADEPEIKKLVDGLKDTTDADHHRASVFDLYSRFWASPKRKQDNGGDFAPELLKEMKEQYGAESFHTDHFADLPDGWVQPAPGSKVMTGQIGKVIRPGLKDANGNMLIPMIAVIE